MSKILIYSIFLLKIIEKGVYLEITKWYRREIIVFFRTIVVDIDSAPLSQCLPYGSGNLSQYGSFIRLYGR